MSKDVPTKGLDKFTISIAALKAGERDLDLQIQAKEHSISNIVHKVTLGDQPAIGFLLSISHNKDELEKLAEGIKRVAQRVSELDELMARKKMIEMAKEKPSELALLFGDFSEEFTDELLHTIISTHARENPADGSGTEI